MNDTSYRSTTPLSVNELLSLGALGNQNIKLPDKVAFIVSKATEEVNRSRNSLRKTQGELNIALQELESTKKVLTKIRVAREKEKVQVHRAHEDRKVELEALRVELVVAKEEIKRTSSQLYDEKQICRSALNNATDNKDKLVKEKFDYEKVKTRLKNDNEKLRLKVQSLQQELTLTEGPLTELEFDLRSSRSNLRKKNAEYALLHVQSKDAQKVLRRSIRENKKLNKFIAKERKKYIKTLNEKDKTIAEHESITTILRTKLEDTEKIVEGLRIQEEETLLRTDERIKAMEKSHQNLIVEFQNKLRKKEMRDITLHLEEFSIQLKEQLEASETAYEELKDRVERHYMTKHEHKSKMNKLKLEHEKERKETEMKRMDTVAIITEEYETKKKIIEADARIKIDAEVGEIEDEVKRNEIHVQNEINMLKSKLAQSTADQNKLRREVKDRYHDIDLIRATLAEERKKSSRLQDKINSADQSAWRLKATIDSTQVMRNKQSKIEQTLKGNIVQLERKNEFLKSRLNETRLELDKLVHVQSLANTRQKDKAAAAKFLESSITDMAQETYKVKAERNEIEDRFNKFQTSSEERIAILQNQILTLKDKLSTAKQIGEEFASKLRNTRELYKKEAEAVIDFKTRNQQLKTHCLSFRDLSERLGKEVKRLNHELNMERARRQPTLRHTTSINNKNRHANTGKSHDKKEARRVKSEPYSNNAKSKTLMKFRKSKTINTLRVQDLKSSEGGNIGNDRTTKEI
jgi:chromosome segregation ATPase